MPVYTNNSASNYLQRTSDMPGRSGITYAMWVRPRTSSSFRGFLFRGASAANSEGNPWFGSNGTTGGVIMNPTGGFESLSGTFATNTWYFNVLVVRASDHLGTAWRFNPDGTTDGSLALTTDAVSATAPQAFRLGRDGFSGQQPNCDIGPTYVFDAELTEEQARAQAFSIRPLYPTFQWHRFTDTADYTDLSGNGRDFAAVGTPVAGVHIPVSYGSAVLWVPRALTGGAGAVLEGASAGTSTAAATTLQLPHALAGSSAGASTAGANLSTAKPLSGASAGTSTAGGDLSTAKPLAGASAGTSTAAATALQLPHALVGASGGTSTAGGDLSVAPSASPVLLDTFTDTNGTALSAHTPDVGGPWVTHDGTPTITSNAVSDTEPWLATVEFGIVDVNIVLLTSNDLGLPAVIFRFTDAANYWEARYDAAAETLELREVVAGVATLRASESYSNGGTNTINVTVAGTVVSANVNGDLPTVSYGTMATGLAATRHGAADDDASGLAAITRLDIGPPGAALAGASAGTSTAGATALQLPHALVAASAGTSTAGANLSTAKPLVGASAGTSTAGANLSTAKPLAGASAGDSTAVGTLRMQHPLIGRSDGTSTAGATGLSLPDVYATGRPGGSGAGLARAGGGGVTARVGGSRG